MIHRKIIIIINKTEKKIQFHRTNVLIFIHAVYCGDEEDLKNK